MEFLYFLESIRNPVLDAFFSIITMLGEETVFMAIGMIVFWCMDKYQGYYLLCTGFLGTAINQFLKMTFKVARPWVKDPNFTIVESAREAATGYSFPSGHTQTSVGAFGGLARWNRNTFLRILAISACVLVPLSRMYLGVHTPMDVGVSIVVALILIFALYPLFKRGASSPKTMYALLSAMVLISLAYLLYAILFPFTADTDAHNLLSAQKNGYTLFGCSLGLLTIYALDRKYISFPTKAVWWAQIIKIVGGIALVLAVKELLRSPIDAIFGGHLIARAVRYFLMVLVGGAIWPLTFKWFSKIDKNIKEAE